MFFLLVLCVLGQLNDKNVDIHKLHEKTNIVITSQTKTNSNSISNIYNSLKIIFVLGSVKIFLHA